jgi:hypothetical protein
MCSCVLCSFTTNIKVNRSTQRSRSIVMFHVHLTYRISFFMCCNVRLYAVLELEEVWRLPHVEQVSDAIVFSR